MFSLSAISNPGHVRKAAAEAMPDLPGLNSHGREATIKKAMVLRKWIMSTGNYCGREYLLPGFERMGLIKQIQALADCQYGVWCGDAAALYVNALRCFYIPATRFFYGHDREGLGGLSHVTVIAGYNVSEPGQPYSFEFAIFDPYLGFHYEDTAGNLMPIHKLIPLVIREEYESIRRVDTKLVRPYLSTPDEKHGFRSWLFPNNKQPEQGDWHGDRLVFQGASHSVGQLFPPGSPMWELAAERRGDKPLEHYLLDLMLVCPRFEDIQPRLSHPSERAKAGDDYPSKQFFRMMTHAVMGAYST